MRPQLLSLFALLLSVSLAAAERPHVILIMTDDQGYPDLGCHGNPILQTPHLDAMKSRSAVLEQFYVSPVCTPTRACLMTGRYNYRTRAIDTYRGRAMMDTAEVTLAEILRGAGYATGIFGKWHLGDTGSLRAMDQGFEEALVHRGGGIGQPSDPPGGEGKYTDPILFRNGKAMALKGYCTDIYFTEAVKWAEAAVQKGKPFFLYLPTNAPHGPYHDVPPDKLAWYKKQAITAQRLASKQGWSAPKKIVADQLARVYAMIANIDDNVGRLFAWLDRRKLTENTLVIFLTDNGPATAGFTAGLRGRKSQVYEGGIRSPFFAHWPARVKAGTTSDRIAAHIDVLPTVLEACGVAAPKGLKLDGRNVLPLLEGKKVNWPERTLFFQAHRGDVPVRYHQFAARTQEWKLVHASGFGQEKFAGTPKLELFHLATDPYEQNDVSASHPGIVARLKKEYEAWFDDVSRTRPDNYAPPRIQLGTPHEDPVVLTRQDWRGANWGPKDHGYWEVQVTQPGAYDVTFRFRKVSQPTTVRLALGEHTAEEKVQAGADAVTFRGVPLPAGPGRLHASVLEGKQPQGVMFVEVSRPR